MTASKTQFQRADRLVVAALASCLALLLGTASVQAQPVTSSNRFLFVIDTSSSMKPFDKGIQDSMFDLIYSGVRGRMTNGDTYGIWLVNEQNDMSFKMETWRQKFTVEMGARAALHVKEHGFKGKLDMAQAMNDALAVIRGVGDLTVILISNGETPLSRTPFDDAVNARFRELAPVMKRKKATINTVLAAQDRKIIAWAVNSPDYPVEVPYVPPKPKPALAPVVIAPLPRPTNALPVAAAPARPEPAKARTNFASIIITKDLVAQERRQFLALASTLTNEPALPTTTNPAPIQIAETNAVAIVATTLATTTIPTTALVPTNGADQKQVSISTTPPVKAAQVTMPAATTTVATITKPEATNVATVTVSVSMPPTPSAATSVASAPVNFTASPAPETNTGSHPVVWLAIGAGAALVCMLSVLLVMRARRPELSLVSQAIIRERMRTS